MTSTDVLKQESVEARASNRSRVANMQGLVRDSSSFSISATKDQLTADADGKFVGLNLGGSFGGSPTATDLALVDLLSSLCQKSTVWVPSS